MLSSNSASLPSSCTQDIDAAFWKLWQQYQDYIYRCCCKWMGNQTDAEDAYSRAMLKALEKARDCTDDIKNFKAWLSRLTYNLCADIHRERKRGSSRIDSIESLAEQEGVELVSQEETPVLAATRRELELFLRNAIDELPDRLRETFILHFESELSYQDIASQLNISYDNVRKRISQARAILRQRFNENFSEDTASRVSPQSAKPRKSKKTAPESVAGEIALSGDLEQVQIVAGGELPEAVEPVLADAQSDEKLEEIEIRPFARIRFMPVGAKHLRPYLAVNQDLDPQMLRPSKDFCKKSIVTDGEPQSAALSVPHREKLELEERMKGEKPSFFSCSNEISAFPSPSQSAIPLLRIASPCALKQLLIWVSLAWSSKTSASFMQETWFLRLLTRGAKIVNKGINST